jgi:hypothetical protein
MSSAEYRARELGISELQWASYAQEEQVIVDRAKKEEEMIGNNWKPLATPVLKGAGAVGGFGLVKVSKKATIDQSKRLGQILRREGVVRCFTILTVRKSYSTTRLSEIY